MSVGKWILGTLGFVVGGPIGSIIGVLIASLFDKDISKNDGLKSKFISLHDVLSIAVSEW